MSEKKIKIYLNVRKRNGRKTIFKMKKYLMILVVLIGFGITANAGNSCPIKGGYGNVTGIVKQNGNNLEITFFNTSSRRALAQWNLVNPENCETTSDYTEVPPKGTKVTILPASTTAYNKTAKRNGVATASGVNVTSADCEGDNE